MSEILTPETITVISTILSFAIGILYKLPAFQKLKSTVHYSKEFLSQIDDALYDPKVTDEEFRKIFDAGKKVIDSGSDKL